MDAQSLLESFGYLMIFVSIFIECGVLLGLILPLPGFSLLFTAGVFAAADKMSLMGIIVVGSLAAVSGYVAGYYTGYSYGRRLLYEKETKKYFTPAQGLAAERFMKKYGYSTLIISRFLPILHNIAPLLSGVAKTPIVPFMIVNIVGGMLWVISSALLGYYIGRSVPGAQYFAVPLFILTMIVVNIPYVKRQMARLARKIEQL